MISIFNDYTLINAPVVYKCHRCGVGLGILQLVERFFAWDKAGCAFHWKRLLFICLQYRSATLWTIFAFNFGVNFWLKLSLSTFDWNFRYQLLIETFGVKIWLKRLIKTFNSNSLSNFDNRTSCRTFVSTFEFKLRNADSCRMFDSKVAV